ncbi:MAG: putative oxidoreductase [Acidimicrobiia bacterium]|nr:putative oxidoreductase [Acidimicrobiia bacterium]
MSGESQAVENANRGARRRVAVVTGGGGGIGTQAALELARQGAVVVAMDPGAGTQGEPLNEPTAAATAELVKAQGGTAISSTASVTDRAAVGALFREVVAEFGSLDIVVNTAGILRFPKLLESTEDDWWSVLDVHLNGYLNVLAEALPIMIDAGYGRIVGFTSGVGLARTLTDGPSYGAAKRAVAALTWQIGRRLPAGVTVNALSPIAASRMVLDGLIAGGVDPKGLDLSAMPQPAHMGPAAAYLASERFGWCTGEVVFSGGSELSVTEPPRLIEVVRTRDVADFAAALGTLVPVVFAPSDAQQRTTGGSNPRFGNVFDGPASDASDSAPVSAPVDVAPQSDTPTCVVVSDDVTFAGRIPAAIAGWGMTTVGIGAWQPNTPAPTTVPTSFADAAEALQLASKATGRIDALVVALGRSRSDIAADTWSELLDSHADASRHIVANAAWLHAAVHHAVNAGHPIRIVFVNDARSLAGQTAAQAIAQVARGADDAAFDAEIDVFSLSVETDQPDLDAVAAFVARLVGAADTLALRGGEFVVGDGWLGLRGHPGPMASVSFGGLAIPDWMDDALQQVMSR